MSGVGSLISCLTWIIAGVGAGILYPVLYKRYGILESGAVGGGAAAGALANVLGYLFTSIISALIFMPLMGDWMNQLMTAAGPVTAAPPDFGMFWGMAFLIGAISARFVALCLWSLLAVSLRDWWGDWRRDLGVFVAIKT